MALIFPFSDSISDDTYSWDYLPWCRYFNSNTCNQYCALSSVWRFNWYRGRSNNTTINTPYFFALVGVIASALQCACLTEGRSPTSKAQQKMLVITSLLLGRHATTAAPTAQECSKAFEPGNYLQLAQEWSKAIEPSFLCRSISSLSTGIFLHCILYPTLAQIQVDNCKA